MSGKPYKPVNLIATVSFETWIKNTRFSSLFICLNLCAVKVCQRVYQLVISPAQLYDPHRSFYYPVFLLPCHLLARTESHIILGKKELSKKPESCIQDAKAPGIAAITLDHNVSKCDPDPIKSSAGSGALQGCLRATSGKSAKQSQQPGRLTELARRP